MTITMKATWRSRKNVQHWSVWLNSELCRKMKTTVDLEYSYFLYFIKDSDHLAPKLLCYHNIILKNR